MENAHDAIQVGMRKKKLLLLSSLTSSSELKNVAPPNVRDQMIRATVFMHWTWKEYIVWSMTVLTFRVTHYLDHLQKQPFRVPSLSSWCNSPNTCMFSRFFSSVPKRELPSCIHGWSDYNHCSHVARCTRFTLGSINVPSFIRQWSGTGSIMTRLRPIDIACQPYKPSFMPRDSGLRVPNPSLGEIGWFLTLEGGVGWGHLS